jgi:hypothetical protein
VSFFIRISEKIAGLAVLGVAGLVLGAAPAAQARVETLRWQHPSPGDVTSFRVYLGSRSGRYTQVINAGRPARSGRTFSFDVQVGDDATVYVAVSALNSAGEGPLSNEQRRAPGSPPQDSPPPPPQDPVDPGDPGTGDAVFRQDFETSATGQYLSGWVDTRAGNSMAQDDSLFSVTTLSGNRVLSTSSTQANIHSHYVSGGSADWSWYELKGRMRISNLAGGIGVTLHSDYRNRDRYYRLRRHSGASFHFRAHRDSYPNDPEYCVGTTDSGVTARANTWYRFRFQALPQDSATRVRAKVWEDGRAEPGGWQIDCLDSSSDQFRSGTVGVWATRAGRKYWDDLEVITSSGGSTPGGSTPGGSTEPLGRPGRPQIILP